MSTLDLMGHKLTGPGSGSNAGIVIGDVSNVVIVNGTITAFGTSGGVYQMYYPDSSRHRLENLRIASNGGPGINLLWPQGIVVQSCTIMENQGGGIVAGKKGVDCRQYDP